MKWIDSEPDIGARSLTDFAPIFGFTDALKFVVKSREAPFVLLDQPVGDEILKHLNSSPLEQGGLLIGQVYSRESLVTGIAVIHVTRSVECTDSYSTGVSLSMSAGVWQSANSLSDQGEFVVGWYHSHPNLGAFFSGTDRKTQRSFFSNAYSLGLVIDPVRSERKWFLGRDCQEIGECNILSLNS